MKFFASVTLLAALVACGGASQPNTAQAGAASDAGPGSSSTEAGTCSSPMVIHQGAVCSSAGRKEIGDVSYAPSQPGANVYVSCACDGHTWQCPSANEALIIACADDTLIGSGSVCTTEGSRCIGYEYDHATTCTCEDGHLVCLRPGCEQAESPTTGAMPRDGGSQDGGYCCPVSGTPGCKARFTAGGIYGGWATRSEDCEGPSPDPAYPLVESVDAHGCTVIRPDFSGRCAADAGNDR